MCVDRFGLGWAHDAICFACHMFMHFSCIRTFFSLYVILLLLLGTFLIFFFFFSLYLCLRYSCLWHLNINPLQPGTLFIPMLLHLLILHLLTFGSVMMMPFRHFRRTSLDETFIQNAKSFCRTLPTPTLPLLFTVGDWSHCVTSRSPVLSCLSRSFTPTCTRLIIQYFSSSLAFEVYTFLSHRNLLQMCFGSLG